MFSVIANSFIKNRTHIWTFIKRWWQTALIVLLVLLIIRMSTCNATYNQQTSLQTISEFEKQPLDSSAITYWKDKYNNEHATVEKLTSTSNKQSHYIDSLAKALKLKPKQIQSIQLIRSETDMVDIPLNTANDYISTPCPDSVIKVIDKIRFKWKDSWTDINGVVNANGKGNRISIKTTDSISIVDYWKRDKVLGLRIGKVRGYVDYQNHNPYSKITGAKKLDLVPPKQRYSLNLSVNAGYNPLQKIDFKKPQFTIGLSIGKTLIKF
jgi:hypothetical protein